jgi:hypothetical protein
MQIIQGYGRKMAGLQARANLLLLLVAVFQYQVTICFQ